MPSGAKKRKAARRRKGIGASNNNPNPGTLSNVNKEEMMNTSEDTSGLRSNKEATYQNSGVQTFKDLKPKDDLSIINLDDSSSSRGSSISSGRNSFGDDSQNNAEVTESGPPTSQHIKHPSMIREYSGLSVLIEKWAQDGLLVPTEEEACHMPQGTQATDGKNKSLEDKVSPISIDTDSQLEEVKVSSDAVDILVLSPDVEAVDSGLNTTSKCSESQPLIPSAPKPVKTSSWKSCCGLFELFTSSDR